MDQRWLEFLKGAGPARLTIALKARNGKCVRAALGNQEDLRLIADRDDIGAWECLSALRLGGGQIALRANNWQLISVDGGDRRLVATASAVGPSETFTVEQVDDGIALRCAANGSWVRAAIDGGGDRKLIADSAQRVDAGTFELTMCSFPRGQVAGFSFVTAVAFDELNHQLSQKFAADQWLPKEWQKIQGDELVQISRIGTPTIDLDPEYGQAIRLNIPIVEGRMAHVEGDGQSSLYDLAGVLVRIVTPTRDMSHERYRGGDLSASILFLDLDSPHVSTRIELYREKGISDEAVVLLAKHVQDHVQWLAAQKQDLMVIGTGLYRPPGGAAPPSDWCTPTAVHFAVSATDRPSVGWMLLQDQLNDPPDFERDNTVGKFAEAIVVDGYSGTLLLGGDVFLAHVFIPALAAALKLDLRYFTYGVDEHGVPCAWNNYVYSHWSSMDLGSRMGNGLIGQGPVSMKVPVSLDSLEVRIADRIEVKYGLGLVNGSITWTDVFDVTLDGGSVHAEYLARIDALANHNAEAAGHILRLLGPIPGFGNASAAILENVRLPIEGDLKPVAAAVHGNNIALFLDSASLTAQGGGRRRPATYRDLLHRSEGHLSDGPAHLRIALVAHNGCYVSARIGHGDSRRLRAIVGVRGAWEVFDLVLVGGAHKVALRASDGGYVRAALGDGEDRTLIVDRGGVAAWETFELIAVDDQHVRLRASNGLYVIAIESGERTLRCDSPNPLSWETFILQIVE